MAYVLLISSPWREERFTPLCSQRLSLSALRLPAAAAAAGVFDAYAASCPAQGSHLVLPGLTLGFCSLNLENGRNLGGYGEHLLI